MWKFLPLLLLVWSSPVDSRILINEVYYDHPGLDTGHEFVELINGSSTRVSLIGYELKFHDGSSPGWVTIWAGSSVDSVAPAELFVVGDRLVPVTPDALVTLRLQNGPDAVGLFHDGVCVDRIGYGALEDTLYYEGDSAEDVAAGRSLARQPDGHDTDDNASDFHSATPSPGVRNIPQFDVTISPGPATPSRAALTRGAEEVSFRVENRGVYRIESGEVTVTLRDSSSAGWQILGAVAVGAMEVGGEFDVSFSLRLAGGYHFLFAWAEWPADERPMDNVARIIRRVGPSNVLISEVMSHPASGCPEYVEVTNVGSLTFPVAGLAIRDAVHAPVRLLAAGELTPGGSIVVTEDPGVLIEWFSTLSIDVVFGVDGTWPSLNHSGSGTVADSVILLDAFGIVVDGVAYPPQPTGTRGTSLERIDLFPGGGNTWVLSSSPGGGSPGRRNPTAIHVVPYGNAMRVSPRTFDPDRGETILITIPEQPQPTRAVVRVFDVDGTKIRELGATNRLPFVFVWNGMTNTGQVVTSGIYVLTCEFIDEGGVRRVEKVTVGRGRTR